MISARIRQNQFQTFSEQVLINMKFMIYKALSSTIIKKAETIKIKQNKTKQTNKQKTATTKKQKQKANEQFFNTPTLCLSAGENC